MKNQNPFAQFTLKAEPISEPPLQNGDANEMVIIPSKPRPRGRPRNNQSVEQAATIFRLNSETHYKLKKLALHDGITLNQLILKCVKEHCQRRGVEIN